MRDLVSLSDCMPDAANREKGTRSPTHVRTARLTRRSGNPRLFLAPGLSRRSTAHLATTPRHHTPPPHHASGDGAAPTWVRVPPQTQNSFIVLGPSAPAGFVRRQAPAASPYRPPVVSVSSAFPFRPCGRPGQPRAPLGHRPTGQLPRLSPRWTQPADSAASRTKWLVAWAQLTPLAAL